MRSNKKIFYALSVLFLLACAFAFFAQPVAAYRIEIGLPNLPAGTDVTDPGKYIEYFFVFGLLLCGFLAVAAIVWGGITYMVAGTISNVEKAKSIIIGAITGIVLLLCSYLLLATIDPTLTNLSPFKPPSAGNIPQQQTQQPAQQPVSQTWVCRSYPSLNILGTYSSESLCTADCDSDLFEICELQ
ncbi:hypothetical protein KJ853_03200 [Patescibacteria group bacterium]|nr:hypothetical protein [Patescibacteria group bacterium]